MSIKSFFVFLIAVIILGFYLLKYYSEYIYLVMTFIFIFGIGFEFIKGKARRDKNDLSVEKVSISEELESQEYHNDFSKVPAGTDSSASSFLEEHPINNKTEKVKKKSSLDV